MLTSICSARWVSFTSSELQIVGSSADELFATIPPMHVRKAQNKTKMIER